MNSIVKVDAKDFGLEENKAQQIAIMFDPMLNKMVELEKEYNALAKIDISEKKCQWAKDLRLQYVKVRTGTAKIHKELKQFYLQGGRFVDGWKNAQLMASGTIENKLKDIEDHYVNIEKEKIQKVEDERTVELLKYGSEIMPKQLGNMPEAVFQNYLTGVKTAYELKIAAEEKAEDERIKLEQQKIAEEKALRAENERLKEQAKADAIIREKERIKFEAKAKEQARAELDRKIQEEERQEKTRLNSREDLVKFKDFKTNILSLIKEYDNFTDQRCADSFNYIKDFITDYLGGEK